jgi:hypothetical protein
MGRYYKFGADKGGTEVEFFYNNIWCVEKYPDYERITIAPYDNQVELMLDILKSFPPPYWCLYVLIVSRTDQKCGRYQCPYPMVYNEIYNFGMKYKDYFETDGRHHIWMGSAKSKQLLVYDHHNVIYVYEDILNSSKYLREKSFIEETVKFPVPHMHNYNKSNDDKEISILKHYKWKRFPLKEQDEYK